MRAPSWASFATHTGRRAGVGERREEPPGIRLRGGGQRRVSLLKYRPGQRRWRWQPRYLQRIAVGHRKCLADNQRARGLEAGAMHLDGDDARAGRGPDRHAVHAAFEIEKGVVDGFGLAAVVAAAPDPRAADVKIHALLESRAT